MPVHLVHTPYLVPAPRIFTYGTAIEPQSPSYDSSEKSVTPKGNPTPRNNPPNPVTNIPYEPYSEPILSDYSLTDSSESSDDECDKIRQLSKNNKKETPE